LTFTDWSGNYYSTQSGGINSESTPGAVILLANASGTYPIIGPEWFTSNTIDLGGASSTLHRFSFDGSMPGGAGPDSLSFQLAANNDNATWNFTGPDGSGSTYYTATSSVPSATLNDKRYLRYKAFLTTIDGLVTPQLDEVTLEFNSNCVPPYQTLFSGLTNATYTIDVSAPGYADNSSPFQLDASWEQAEILL
jgi:hypothetical protein